MGKFDLGRVAGADVKVNGQPTTTIAGSDGVAIEQQGSQLVMKADSDGIQMNLGGLPGQYVGFDANGKAVPFELYGMQIDLLESDPESKIQYMYNNMNYESARLKWVPETIGGHTVMVQKFVMGNNWGNAFFIKNLRPCMLNYDGTVAYDLDKDDYTKKSDGTPSDITDENFPGNVMVGIPTVWIKVDNSDVDRPKIYFSNIQVDSNFHAYAHHDNNGNIMPYTYLPAYDGWKDGNGRIRSLSGKIPGHDQNTWSNPEYAGWNPSELVGYARANNPTGEDIWDVEKFVDRNLINLLLILISKTTDTQAAFGNGKVESEDEYVNSGQLNTSGLFYGKTGDSMTPVTNTPVKVFGIENWWGNVSRLTMGIVMMKPGGGNIAYKLTYGTEDGSVVTGFDLNSILNIWYDEDLGWISTNIIPVGRFIEKMNIGANGAMIPIDRQSVASDSTYFCDNLEYAMFSPSENGSMLATFGGHSSVGQFIKYSGAFQTWFVNNSYTSYNNVGATLSCKPIVTS